MSSDKPKVLTLYPPNAGSEFGLKSVYFPLGIGYVAAVLEEDYDVKVHDLNFDFNLGYFNEETAREYIRRILSGYDYEVLLIGGVFPKYKILKQIIEVSRDVSEARIVLGGSYLKPSIETLPAYLNADYYILGEGEGSIRELLDSLAASRSVDTVANVAYREGSKVRYSGAHPETLDIDSIPFPARRLVDFNQYKRYFARAQPLVYSTQIIASRGCPFNCIFCNPAFGRRANIRSPENIVEEMELLDTDYDCRYFFLHDEMMLGGKKEKIREFCEYLIHHKSGRYFWGGTINHQLVDYEMLSLLKRAGCGRLCFGVESGSDKVLREMRKRHNLDKLRENIKHCNQLGIDVTLSLITNTFSETEETLNETKKFILSCMDRYFRSIPQMNFLIPIPGTDIYDEAKKRNLIPKDDLSNLLKLDEQFRYGLHQNLTTIEDDAFVSLVGQMNSEMSDSYYRKHPFQHLLQKIGNLPHFQFQETLQSASEGNLRAMFEGMLWVLSKGEETNLFGKFYKHCVHGQVLKPLEKGDFRA